MQKLLLKKWMLFFFIFLTVITIYFSFSRMNATKTDIVLYGSSDDSIDAECLIVRDEAVVETPENANTIFCAQDGEKIEVGHEIARIYRNFQEANEQEKLKNIKEKIFDLEEKIDMFKNVNADPDTVSQNLSKIVCITTGEYLNNNILRIKECKSGIMKALMDQEKMHSYSEEFFNKLFELKQQKKEIEKKLGTVEYKKVLATNPGYFKCCTDGFENLTDLNKILSFNSENLKYLLETSPKKDKNKAKIVRSQYWYILVNVSSEKAKKLVCGNSVILSSLSDGIKKIPATIVAINFDKNRNGACLILKSNYINKEILSLRKEKIHISFNVYTGLKFSKKAMHEKIVPKKFTNEAGKETIVNSPICGAYVKDSLNNKKFKFKEIQPLFVDDNFVICKNPKTEQDGIKLHDEVLI